MSERKVAVVTGGNKGIGYAIVRGLCKRFDGIVYLKADLDRMDITNLGTVQTFHDMIYDKYGGIDLLINNAGVALPEPDCEQALDIVHANYFSTSRTCKILLHMVRNGGRVINITCSDGHLTSIPSEALRNKFKDPSLTICGLNVLMYQFIEAARLGTHLPEWGKSAYAVSKVGLTALTRIQQKMYNDQNIIINAVNPGCVATDMTSHKGLLTIDEGAEAPLYLALDADDSVKGQFVWHDKKVVNWEADKPTE